VSEQSGADPLVRSRPPVGSSFSTRIPERFQHYCCVTFYRRRLPHLYTEHQPVFITWRLHDSLPPNRHFSVSTMTSGQAFAAMDRLLDQARGGMVYLRQPEIADMVVEAIQHNAKNLEHYKLHALS
jgi:hypothetical protein